MGIVQAVRNLLGSEPVEREYFANWTKRLFDAQGNEVELTEFVKLHYMDFGGRWVEKQFPSDGLYWLLYGSDDKEQTDGGLVLMHVARQSRHSRVSYIGRSARTIEQTIAAYERDSFDEVPIVVPPVVRSAALELITDHV